MKFLISLAVLLALLFGAYYYVKETYTAYYVDPFNVCTWQGGKIVATTDAANRSTMRLIKRAEEAEFLRNAQATGQCIISTRFL